MASYKRFVSSSAIVKGDTWPTNLFVVFNSSGTFKRTFSCSRRTSVLVLMLVDCRNLFEWYELPVLPQVFCCSRVIIVLPSSCVNSIVEFFKNTPRSDLRLCCLQRVLCPRTLKVSVFPQDSARFFPRNLQAHSFLRNRRVPNRTLS